MVGPWLRRNVVNANEAAANICCFDRLGEKVRPGTFGTIVDVDVNDFIRQSWMSRVKHPMLQLSQDVTT